MKTIIHTMKSYTDLEQSKKLAEILSYDTVDQIWVDVPNSFTQYRHEGDIPYLYYSGIGIPCWSLSALLNIINKNFYPNIFHDGEAWNIEVTHHDNNAIKYETHCNDVIDGVFEIIINLHEKDII